MMLIETTFGPCAVHEDGADDGLPLLLVHGVFVTGSVWDDVVPALAARHRVLRPDLPLGAHHVPATRRDRLHPDGIADALAEVLDAHGIGQAVVVGSDTGGALSQVFAANHPDRVAGLVLLSSDTLDHFPPTIVKPLAQAVRVPGVATALATLYRSRRVRRSSLGAGLLISPPIDDARIAPWFDQLSTSRPAQRDLAAFLPTCRPAVAHAAVAALEANPPPTALIWSRGDRLFPDSDAEELHRRIAGSTLTFVDDARTFSQIDQPEAVLAALGPFLDRIAVGSAPQV